MGNSEAKGLLSIEVKAPPIVAGTPSTVSLIIRNPFPHQVVIESIQAPSSAPLLPSSPGGVERTSHTNDNKVGFFRGLLSSLSFQIKEIQVGPLTAQFPDTPGRNFHINTAVSG